MREQGQALLMPLAISLLQVVSYVLCDDLCIVHHRPF
jgi:hypothetical protein